jgi:hypothetical protein
MARCFGLALVAAGVLAAPPARAQLCHPAADDAGDGTDYDDEDDHDMHMHDMQGMHDMSSMHHAARPRQPSLDTVTARAGLEADVATIDAGSYAGLVPSASVAWWRLEARLAAPVYHLEYRGVKSDGAGDLLASLTGTLVAGRHLRAGVALAVTAPTGNQAVGLGMGDIMWMPGAWASWSGGRWSTVASGSYGRMAGSLDEHAHHTGFVGSLVNPMNHEELAGAVRGTYRATRALRVHALASLATPIGIDGTTRAYAAAGSRYALGGGWDVGAEAALPIAGDPFHARFALDVARSF